MLRLATDENFTRAIVAGLTLRRPDLDVKSAQAAGLAGRPDDEILAWAAAEDRLLLTHDAQSMDQHFRSRLDRGLANPGVLLVPATIPIRQAIEDLELFAVASFDREWQGIFLRLDRQ